MSPLDTTTWGNDGCSSNRLLETCDYVPVSTVRNDGLARVLRAECRSSRPVDVARRRADGHGVRATVQSLDGDGLLAVTVDCGGQRHGERPTCGICQYHPVKRLHRIRGCHRDCVPRQPPRHRVERTQPRVRPCADLCRQVLRRRCVGHGVMPVPVVIHFTIVTGTTYTKPSRTRSGEPPWSSSSGGASTFFIRTE